MSDPQILSYLAVRRTLGLLGLSLPVMLLVYGHSPGRAMQPSISEFYHTEMGDLLVGTLVAIGIFLISYLDYPPRPGERLSDRWVARIAGVGAIGVALLPVAPPDPAACPPGAQVAMAGPPARLLNCPVQGLVAHWNGYAWLHAAAAAAFFIALALFCLCLFPRGNRRPDGRIDWRAPRNRIYAVCGAALLLSLAGLGLYAALGPGAKAALRARHFVFWAETLGVMAFGISWLVKGRAADALRRLIPLRLSCR